MADSTIGPMFITVVIFLGIFAFLVGGVPLNVVPMTDQGYILKTYPDIFDPLTMQKFNFSASESFLLTFTSPENKSDPFYLGNNELVIASYTLLGSSRLYMQHNTPWFIFSGWHLLQTPNLVSLIGLDEVLKYYSNNTDLSVFTLECDHLTLTTIIGFNTSIYNTLELAWSNKEIFVTVGIGYDQLLGTRLGAWSLISQLLLFQAPDIHPAINGLIAIPLWACIGYVVYRLILLAFPFGVG